MIFEHQIQELIDKYEESYGSMSFSNDLETGAQTVLTVVINDLKELI